MCNSAYLRNVVFRRALLHVPPFFFFFFNDTATTEIYTLSLHDALPISRLGRAGGIFRRVRRNAGKNRASSAWARPRSEEHTSELQSRLHLVCRLLLEKKKKERHTASDTRSGRPSEM